MDWKKIGKRMLFPPFWLLMILTVISAMGLAVVFIKGWEESVIAYGIYVLSFYTVVALGFFFAKVVPKHYRNTKQRIYDHPLGNRYMTDATFRVRISLYMSLAINFAYAAFKFVCGVYYSSFWIGSVAVYYMLLALIRFLLLRFMRDKQGTCDIIAEYRRYRLSAILMLLINLILSGIVLNMIVKNESAGYSDIYVITSATYTFYTLTVSIVDIVKYRKYQSPILSAAKAIRFVQALVSLLSLEAAMLIQFGEDEEFRKLMLALTGAGVCIIVLGMSVYMIVRATREIKKGNEQ